MRKTFLDGIKYKKCASHSVNIMHWTSVLILPIDIHTLVTLLWPDTLLSCCGGNRLCGEIHSFVFNEQKSVIAFSASIFHLAIFKWEFLHFASIHYYQQHLKKRKYRKKCSQKKEKQKRMLTFFYLWCHSWSMAK